MRTINKVILLGIVGKAPEVRHTQSGIMVANFSLATSRKAKDKDEVTQWHQMVAFGKTAAIIEQYVAKGSKLYIEGEIQYYEYEKDGERRFSSKIVVNELSLLSSLQPKDGNDNPLSSGNKQKDVDSGTFSEPVFSDDDLPF